MSATMLFNNLITFSRGSNATLVDSTGKVTYAPANLLPYSEQFDTGSWTKSSSSVSANVTASPSGAVNADKLIEDSTNGIHRLVIGVTLSLNSYVMSVYAKAGERSWIAVANASDAQYAYFDLANGVVGTILGSVTASISNVGGGWYRCAIQFTPTSAAAKTIGYYLADGNGGISYQGNGSSGAYFWGAQLEPVTYQTSPSTYVSTTPPNLLGYSEAFDNAAWTKTRASIVTGAAANPVNGLFNAQKLMEDTTASATHPVSVAFTAVANPTTLSVYAKAAGRNWLYLAILGTTNSFASFNLSTGVAGTVGAAATAAIQDVGNGWYRCCITSTTTAGASTAAIYPASADNTISYTGDGNSGIYIWGAQLSDSGSLDPYVPTPGAAPTSTAYYGPRFDYDPVTLAAKGLLIEEQRANLAVQSQFAASWTASAATLTAAAASSPDGTTTAASLADSAANSVHVIYQGVSTVATTPYAFSVYAKVGTGRYLTLSAVNGTSTGAYAATFDLQSGTVTQSGAYGASATYGTSGITNAGNGWWRIYVTGTGSSTVTTLEICPSDAGTFSADTFGRNSYVGSGSTYYIWGAQLEAGSSSTFDTFATSYIPTVASTVTRSADIATMTGANFSAWYNQSAGTFVWSYSAFGQAVPTGRVFASGVGGSNDYGIFPIVSSGTQNSIYIRDVSGDAISGTNYTANATVNKGAAAYAAANFGVASNGTLAITASSGAVPSQSNQLRIGRAINTDVAFLNGHIRTLAYYPDRLSNTQLQSLTT